MSQLLETVNLRKVWLFLKKKYPNIDMEKTGLFLKQKIEQAGYSVKDIQTLLMLSCPQSIYRWFKGQVLPSVDHLYVLSRILKIHMEDFLVPKVLPVGAADIGKSAETKDYIHIGFV